MNLWRHGPTVDNFSPALFALEREQPERVQVLLEHDDNKVVGHLDLLRNENGWLVGTFTLDQRSSWSGVAEDLLTVGCPISVAYSPTDQADWKQDEIKRTVVGELHEISIVPNGGAIKGAEIIDRQAIPEPVTTRSSRRLGPESPPIAGLSLPAK